MIELFPIAPKLPEGFYYRDDFLTENEERELYNIIKTLDLHPMMFQGYEAKRKVASFGFDYSFDNRRLKKGQEIPTTLTWLVTKTADHLSIAPEAFAELLVTEYPVGSVINWHRDAPPFELIAGISLLSDCIFKLRPHEKEKQTRKATLSLLNYASNVKEIIGTSTQGPKKREHPQVFSSRFYETFLDHDFLPPNCFAGVFRLGSYFTSCFSLLFT